MLVTLPNSESPIDMDIDLTEFKMTNQNESYWEGFYGTLYIRIHKNKTTPQHVEEKIKMITKHERNVEFEIELKALLKKHNAEMEIHDKGDKHGLTQQTILVTMSTVYEPNGNKILKEYSEFDMGRWVPA